MTLNPQQFTVYRGLYLGQHDPHDDALAERIRHRPATPDFVDRAVAYGSHWTTDVDTARTFALRASTNLYPRGPGAFSQRPRTGVVLEARVNVEPRLSEHSRGYGEREVAFPGQLPVESLTAHVHHLPAEVSVHRHDTFLRSIQVR